VQAITLTLHRGVAVARFTNNPLPLEAETHLSPDVSGLKMRRSPPIGDKNTRRTRSRIISFFKNSSQASTTSL
jgi:hypothetical protein